MTTEQQEQLERLIAGRNPVRVSVAHPAPAFLTPSVVRQRFTVGEVVDDGPDGGMAVKLKDGSIIYVSAKG